MSKDSVPTAEMEAGNGHAPAPGAYAGLFEIEGGSGSAAAITPPMSACSSGRFALSHGKGHGFALTRSPQSMRLCPLDAYGLLMVSEAGGAPSNQVTIVDTRRIFRIDASPKDQSAHLHIITLWFPRVHSDKLTVANSDHHMASADSDSVPGRIVGDALQVLASRCETMSSAEIDIVAEAIVAIALRAFRPRPEAERAVSLLETVEAISTYIDRNLGSPRLSPDSIATNFGLSRSTLYRLFEPLGGIAGYIRARRMQRVYAEITSPARANRRIGPAAFAVGFKNFSAFSRAFRETYGVTPAEARRNAIAGAAPTADASNAGEISTLCRWVRDLRP